MTKICNKCREEKPLSDFYKCKRWSDGHDYSCKSCRSEMNKSSVAKKRSTPEGLIEHREMQRVYRGSWLSKKPEYKSVLRQKSRDHYVKNKEVYIARVRARKAKVIGSGGSHNTDAWRQLLELFGYQCVCCGATENITRDHVIPISVGGTDNIDNIQPLCLDCNKRKFQKCSDYRTIDKVVLSELNDVGKVIFGNQLNSNTLRKHHVKSGYTGVYYDCSSSIKPWKSIITVNKKRMYLGRFATKEDAAKAYNQAATKYRGEQTCVNVVN